MFTRPLLLAGLAGLICLLFAVLVGLPVREHKAAFNYPKGFSEPMLTLEFIPDSAALHAFLGETPGSDSRKIRALEYALRRDNFFACAYTLFLIAFAISVRFVTRNKKYWLLIPLALLTGFSDLAENGHMRNLLNAGAPDSISFRAMHLFAWIKWLGLVVYFQFCALFFRTGGRLGRVLALLAWVAPIMGAVAFATNKMIQPFAFLVMYIIFPLSLVFCFSYKKQRNTPTTLK